MINIQYILLQNINAVFTSNIKTYCNFELRYANYDERKSDPQGLNLTDFLDFKIQTLQQKMGSLKKFS